MKHDEKNGQGKLLEVSEPHDKLWKGMPEFKSEDLKQVRTMYVHFAKHEDVQEFAKLIGQKITDKTKFIWYPKAEIEKVEHLRYVSSLPDPEDAEAEEEQVES
jgi:tagatose-1,6-bisphosphate aldolase